MKTFFTTLIIVLLVFLLGSDLAIAQPGMPAPPNAPLGSSFILVLAAIAGGYFALKWKRQ